MHETHSPNALPPIFIDSLLDDPGLLRPMIEQQAPYFPVQRYFAGNAEYRASSGQGGSNIIAPNFRGDWAYERPLVDGAELFFDHEGLREAAGRLFDSDCVRPLAVYTNLTWQLPFPQGGGHTDVPAFRGIDRKQYPIWLLSTMGHSRLFENERVRIATAVAWFYEGSDGGFEFWPDGPDAPPQIHEGRVFNTAVMGDNDRMFHRVRPVGAKEKGLLTKMTLATRLEHLGGDDWQIADGDEVLASLPYSEIRISVSWKAEVFRDEQERRLVDEHRADLTLEDVLSRFYADLDLRGIPFQKPEPEDALRDENFIDCLSGTYRTEPTVFS